MKDRSEREATSIVGLLTFIAGFLAAAAIELLGWAQLFERGAAARGLGTIVLGAALGIALGSLYYAVQCRFQARARELIMARTRSSIDGTSAF